MNGSLWFLAQTAGRFSRTHCPCGYVQETHQRILGLPVEVEHADAVLWGGKRYMFRLTLA